jgi:DNA repair ATPase RecN
MKRFGLLFLLFVALSLVSLSAQSDSEASEESLRFLQLVDELDQSPGDELVKIRVSSLRELARQLRESLTTLEVSDAKLAIYAQVLERLEERLDKYEKELNDQGEDLQKISENISTPSLGLSLGPTWNESDGFGIVFTLNIDL